MTYLDPHHARSHPDWGKLILRVLIAAGVVGFGWFVVNLADYGDSSGDSAVPMVAEPAARSF